MARRLSTTRLRAAALLFAALGDPTRLDLVARLSAGGPGSITELSEGARVSRQAVTKHLRVLADAGLVHHYHRGREHVYELAPARLGDAHAFLNRIDTQWSAALERLRRLVEDEHEG